jgi:carboxylesterase
VTPSKQEFSDKIIAGAEPFFFPAGKTGCLLIHGISGTPQVMRLMGEYLAAAGITALGVRLKGHATRVEDMHFCTYQDWVTSAEEALNQLKEHCSTVFCAGLSMGGVISLRMAALHPTDIAGVVTICSPYELRAFKFKFVPLLKRVIKKLATGPRSTNDPLAVEINYDYHSIPAVHELIKLTAVVRADLPSVRQPVLIFGARQDNTVAGCDIDLYYEKLASSEKEIIWLENSQHVATIDYDKEIIFQKTVEFISAHQ